MEGITFSSPGNFQMPKLQYDRKSGLFRLLETYIFTWESQPGFEKRLICPAGFEYDKASVPRLLWGIARPDGPWEAAALFHDRLYRFKGKLPDGEFQVKLRGTWRNDPSPWTRRDADNLLEYMGVLGGASKFEAWKYKTAVQLYPPNWFKGF
jgi:hypothetical protein